MYDVCMMICNKCGESKSRSEFSARSAVPAGIRPTCKKCVNIGAKLSRDKTIASDIDKARAKNWKNNLWRSFKMTPEEWLAIYEKQNGVCLYCGNPETTMLNGVVKRLAVDHDHDCCPSWKNSCGKCVRGLACARCNQLVGVLEKNKDLIKTINQKINSLAIEAFNDGEAE